MEKPKRVLTEAQRLAFLKGREKRMANIEKKRLEKIEEFVPPDVVPPVPKLKRAKKVVPPPPSLQPPPPPAVVEPEPEIQETKISSEPVVEATLPPQPPPPPNNLSLDEESINKIVDRLYGVMKPATPAVTTRPKKTRTKKETPDPTPDTPPVINSFSWL